jgi:hypothetical protein
MTGDLWTAQDPGSAHRAKTGYGVQVETQHVRDRSGEVGIAPVCRVPVGLW